MGGGGEGGRFGGKIMSLALDKLNFEVILETYIISHLSR